MKLSSRIAAAACLLSLWSSAQAQTATDIPAEDRQKIEAALPEAARIQPEQPRRLLVFSRTGGFVHSAIPYGASAVQMLGEKTGAFEAVLSDDIAMFEPDTLAGFDAVLMNNTTGEPFRPADFDSLSDADKQAATEREQRLQQSLESFVREGGGLAGFHAATDTGYQWPAYGAMMGGYFKGHPWNEEVGIKIADSGNALTQAFSGDFIIADEIYQFADEYSRDNLHVLLTLDPAHTDMTKHGMVRPDNDYGVAWIQQVGEGRVFYGSLGHRHEIFWTPEILQFYLDGLQYALGDLEADATPSAELGEAGANPFAPVALIGEDFSGWLLKDGSWTLEDGVLARVGGGYLWTEQEYGDFILDLEFKIDKGSNSGVFFRTANMEDPVQTGMEIQVYDTFGQEELNKGMGGALYDVKEPMKNAMKPAGEWNALRIQATGNIIRANLNGEQILSVNLDEWTEPHRNPDGTENKFDTAYRDMPKRGHIGFQEHGNPVWYRNVRITALD